MPLQILNSAGDVATALREAIATALPGADVRVVANSPGHFEIDVASAVFAGKSMVQQQQLVYSAIKALMAGDSAPVHAIDRLRTKTP